MRVVRGLWWSCVAIFGTLGLVGAGTLMPPGAVFGIAVLAVLVSVVVRELAPDWAAYGLDPSWGGVAIAGGTAVAAVALAGLVAVSGLSGAAVGLLLAGAGLARDRLGEYRLMGRAKDRRAGAAPLAGPTTSAATSGVALAACSLTDEQLCVAWRVSCIAVQRAAGASEGARLAGVRASYLDELERRAPDSFARWIAAGPRAASDPRPFLAPGRGQQRNSS